MKDSTRELIKMLKWFATQAKGDLTRQVMADALRSQKRAWGTVEYRAYL